MGYICGVCLLSSELIYVFGSARWQCVTALESQEEITLRLWRSRCICEEKKDAQVKREKTWILKIALSGWSLVFHLHAWSAAPLGFFWVFLFFLQFNHSFFCHPLLKQWRASRRCWYLRCWWWSQWGQSDQSLWLCGLERRLSRSFQGGGWKTCGRSRSSAWTLFFSVLERWSLDPTTRCSDNLSVIKKKKSTL